MSDNLASASIASMAVYLTGHLNVTLLEGLGLGIAIIVSLGSGLYFRSAL